ncbi:MAG: hypothetical protein PHV53_07440 [Fermentimonas sp.]|nr:hypothetical protein [Fermentimonas sp.]
MKRTTLLLTLIFLTTFSVLSQKALSHYLFPEFTQGVVLMKSGEENPALLNYNLVTEEMLFDQGGQILAFAEVTINNLDSVFIANRKFVLNNKNKFVEVSEGNGYKLYIEHKCRLLLPGKPAGYGGTSQTSAVDIYSSILDGGMWHKLELPDDYKIKLFNVYWIDNGSGVKEIRSERQLKRFYGKNRDLYNSFIKEHNLDFDNYESVKELIHYIESNSK